MDLTDNEVANSQSTRATNLKIAQELLEASDEDLDQVKNKVKRVCACLSVHSRLNLLEVVFKSITSTTMYSTDRFLKRLRRTEWLVSGVTGRAAQHVLELLFQELVATNSRISITQHIVPGLILQCLIGWKDSDKDTALRVDWKCMVGLSSPLDSYMPHGYMYMWAAAWNNAVALGFATYAEHLAPILLATTPLAEVLVQLTLAYICLG
jgi:MFS superfamily sulfate permease-like transporter